MWRLIRDLGLAAVILAGGKGERFGGNKLLAEMPGGETVIGRVVDAVRASNLVEEGFLAVRTRGMGEKLSAELGMSHIVDMLGEEGPHIAMLTALEALDYEEYLFVPGDMPYITGETLDRLVAEARSREAFCASPMWGNGVVEALLVYYRRTGAEDLLREALRLKNLRPSDLHRASARTLLLGVSSLTRSPEEFSNINRPEDLVRPRARGVPTDRVVVLEKHSEHYGNAVKMLMDGRAAEASREFAEEGDIYSSEQVYHLAYHAYLDCAKLGAPNLEPRCNSAVRLVKQSMGVTTFHK